MVKTLRLTISRVIILSIALRLLTLIALELLTSQTRAFDTSHELFEPTSAPSTLRWDAVHFASIALHGYQHELKLAFFPGWPWLMQCTSTVIGRLRGGRDQSLRDVVWAGTGLNVVANAGATLTLYKLTNRLHHERFALVTSLLYTFCPTPAIVVSPFTEPNYALATFAGFLLAAKRQFLGAACLLALGTSIRATGVFASGIIGWTSLFPGGVLPTSGSTSKYLMSRLPLAFACGVVVVLPFVAFQIYAYASFCLPDATRPWCSWTLPIAYSFVQKEYWNVGLLNYWTFDQLPNLLIAVPVLVPSVWGSVRYLREAGKVARATKGSAIESSHPLLLPLHLHHLLMTLLLVFSSHTQIALRVSLADPVVWWNVASLSFDWQSGKMATFGKVWIWWAVIWGALSIVLWASHLPPA